MRDRANGRSYALKLLAEEASEREMAALVREAVALSGLEGLGVPRVVRFGRLPSSQRPYLVREIVEGESLEAALANGVQARVSLEILARAADQLTLLHRAGLLHGDVKPANLIVEPSGNVAFVDLGLAAPWREGGSLAEGLTPRYAAPELFAGKPITVRAEVFALGVVLSEILDAGGARLDPAIVQRLGEVAERAMAREPEDPGAVLTWDDDRGRGLNARIVRKLQPGEYWLTVRHKTPTATGQYTIGVKKRA